jgi:hypothetical protein
MPRPSRQDARAEALGRAQGREDAPPVLSGEGWGGQGEGESLMDVIQHCRAASRAHPSTSRTGYPRDVSWET